MSFELQQLPKFLKDGSHCGFFGGAFDPPHAGHLALAKALCDAGGLDGALIAPSYHPPHKRQAVASFADRLAMCELAVAGEENFVVSDIESHTSTPCYTVEVVAELLRVLPNVKFSVLIGADNLGILASWVRIEELLGMAPLLVGSRPQFEMEMREDIKATLSEALKARVKIVQTPLIDISSSTLRGAYGASDTTRENMHENKREGMIPTVDDYIEKHRLYR